MRRLLTAGIFGTILGIVGAGTANASIVSSGFLDEKLTEMTNATTLQLDNKANQKDLTALNDIVGKENWDIVLNLKNKDFPHLSELFPNLAPDKGMPIPDISNYIYDNLKLIDTPNLAGVTDKFLHGWTNSDNLTRQGLIALNDGWTSTDGTTYLGVKDLNTKIGTLPSGYFPEFPKSENFFSSLRQPLTYPTSLAELITAIYGNSETRVNGLLATIITGFSLDRDGDGILDSRAGLIPNLDLAKNANDLANANATKIGDLPTEYATVGAALTAIKGIAEDAKAAALAAIPDPKQEGSSGKFVLTVDIVGDNATYRWEKIDREGEATTTTE